MDSSGGSRRKRRSTPMRSSSRKRVAPVYENYEKEGSDVDYENDINDDDIRSKRCLECPMKVGCHVSAAGKMENAVHNAVSVGCTAFAFFLRSPRSWAMNSLPKSSVDAFRNAMKEFGFTSAHVVPHGSYLANFASPNVETRDKAQQSIVFEAQRASYLGLKFLNVHCGSLGSKGAKISREQGIKHVVTAVDRANELVKDVVILLENSASSLGCTFEDLRDIIQDLKHKDRVGVTLDTAHLHGAGYDIRTVDSCKKTFAEFDRIVGANYLMALHLNDSKAELKSMRDLHENIGKGKIGITCFEFIMNEPRFQNMPMVVETKGPFDVEVRTLFDLHRSI